MTGTEPCKHLGNSVPDRKNVICNIPEIKMCSVSLKSSKKASPVRIDSGRWQAVTERGMQGLAGNSV